MNIKDIAKIAGVSVATVSRVINGNKSVKKIVRERVEAIIKDNNYVPNTIGISLLKKRSNLIGIILPAVHSYYTERFNKIAKVCSQKGYGNLVVVTSYNEDEEVRALSHFLEKQVDGVIFMTTAITEKHVAIMNKYKERTPIIVLDSDASDYEIPSIINDNYGGARKAVRYLINRGHRKIAFVSGSNTNLYDTSERFRAYVDEMAIAGIGRENLIVIAGNYSLRSGFEAVDIIMADKTNLPTAIFTANDSMAIGAARRLYELGYKIPENISLVGTDDIEITKYTCPATITTVRQELSESGKAAIEMIMEYIETGKIRFKKIVMEQKLIERESVKDIRNT